MCWISLHNLLILNWPWIWIQCIIFICSAEGFHWCSRTEPQCQGGRCWTDIRAACGEHGHVCTVTADGNTSSHVQGTSACNTVCMECMYWYVQSYVTKGTKLTSFWFPQFILKVIFLCKQRNYFLEFLFIIYLFHTLRIGSICVVLNINTCLYTYLATSDFKRLFYLLTPT